MQPNDEPAQATDAKACGPGLHSLELEGVADLPARVFHAFLQTVRLHRQLMTATMAEHGAHPGQAICLRMLEGSDGITQRDLADALHLARPTVSKMLRGMEQAGLIDRLPDERDQRLTRVFLTDHGRDLAAQLRVVAAGHINETIGSLPDADLEQLARLLNDLATRISEVLEKHEAERMPAADGAEQ